MKVLEALDCGVLRHLEQGDRLLPGILHSDQSETSARLCLPIGVEHIPSGIALVLIPGGKFQFGEDPGANPGVMRHRHAESFPRRTLRVEPFYIGITPVTRGQWLKIMSSLPPSADGPDHPVASVSFTDVKEFLGRTGGVLELPREDLWERAAQGGQVGEAWSGLGHCDEFESPGSRPQGTAEVGMCSDLNPYGLLDVLGNVWEICEDYEREGQFALRGGSFRNSLRGLRIGYRIPIERGQCAPSPQVGFRCACRIEI